jgi:hypothetical protein
MRGQSIIEDYEEVNTNKGSEAPETLGLLSLLPTRPHNR